MACAQSSVKLPILALVLSANSSQKVRANTYMSIRLVHNNEEQKLVKACLKGKREAQAALYQRYASKMHAVCHMYTRDKCTADEILQEGFIKVFRNLKQFNQKGSLEGWIRRTIVNTAIDHYRKNHVKRHMQEFDEVVAGDTDYHVTNEGLNNLDHIDYQVILANLPKGYQTILNLSVLEGYTHREIGEMLGISEGTSKSQLSKAKKYLRKIIAGYVDEEVLNIYAKRSDKSVV